MRIKKYKQNEYLDADGIWVRNFCKPAAPIDINNLFPEGYSHVLSNEVSNTRLRLSYIDSEPIRMQNVVIVSDGYEFKTRQKHLLPLPFKDVTVIGVNGSLANWKMVGQNVPTDQKRSMHFYLTNNPYPEAVSDVPKDHRYFPKCITSVRTHPSFFAKYEGMKYLYSPTHDENYSGGGFEHVFTVDDYRNPICAAICLAQKFGVRKLALFGCDDSFANERPAAVQLENKLWCYPQHLKSHAVIDGCLYWLKQYGVKLKDYSSGPKYKNAEYIAAEDLLDFFKE